MLVHLSNGIVAAGHPVSLLCIKDNSVHLKKLDSRVSLIRLGARHSIAAIPALVAYLKANKPSSLLVAKDRAARSVIVAKKISGVPTKIWIRIGTNLTAALRQKNRLHRMMRHFLLPYCYHAATGVIAVSEGVAKDICARTGLAHEKVTVIKNPVISSDITALSRERPPHPLFAKMFAHSGAPVIVGMGRIAPEKDFATLIKAALQVREKKEVSLCIVGRGDPSPLLSQFGWSSAPDWLTFVGFADNPYPYLKHCAVFVLSSRWEGSPNALTEALALGTQVVSTDCPSGPHEVLMGGTVAPLVPVGDSHAMATAIHEVLDRPRNQETLTDAVRAYTVSASSSAYLTLLG